MKKILLILSLTFSLLGTAQDMVNQPLRERLNEMANGKILPAVTVRQIPAPPAITELPAPNKWGECSSFTGFLSFPDLKMASQDLTVLTGYDQEKFYFLCLIPTRKDENWNCPTRKRDDMQLYRDKLVLEWFFYSEQDSRLRRIAINGAGSIVDSLEGSERWNGNWQIATGNTEAGQNLKSLFPLPENFIYIAGALPWADLDFQAVPGNEMRFNLFLCGNYNLSFAPIDNSALDKRNFASLKLVAADAPAVAVYRLGDLLHGNIRFFGKMFNTVGEFDAIGVSPGTRLKVVTGYDEVAGVLENIKKELPPKPLSFEQALRDSRIKLLDLTVKSNKQTLLRLNGPVTVESGILLKAAAYPSQQKIRFTLDYPHFKSPSTCVLTIKDAAGTLVNSTQIPLKSTSSEYVWDYSGRSPGKYSAECRLASPEIFCREELEIPSEPEWLHNKIGITEKVLIPFEPLSRQGNQVSMWHRAYQWDKNSILFNYQAGGRNPLLKSPTLNIRSGNKLHIIPLDDFTITSETAARMEFSAGGRQGNFEVSIDGWVEYDGLCWHRLKINSSETIDAMYLEFNFKREAGMYKLLTPVRNQDGKIPDGRTVYPWQVYFWVGNPEGGIGFISESMRNWNTSRKAPAFELIADARQTVWRINLIGSRLKPVNYDIEFGLQVTPVKPLPQDYHSLMTNNWDKNSKSIFNRLGQANDFTTIWYQHNCPYMKSFCDPAGVDYRMLKEAVENAQAKNIPAIPYFAPISFTENNDRPEHKIFHAEWIQEPLRHWKIKDDIQARACLNSSFQNWTIWQMRQVVRNTRCNGLYFDGAWPVECSNASHGCGWVDAQGVRQPTYAVLATREFLKRIAVMLEEETTSFPDLKPKTTVEGKPYPAYRFWLHNSTSFGLPVQAFGTDYFTGEHLKFALRKGKTYKDLLTEDNFRPRFISQPWGVPNYFLAICSPRHSVKEQTDNTLAFLLPQGVPIYARYLDAETILAVSKIMHDFGTPGCDFVPAWRLDGKFAPKDSGAMTGAWKRKDGAELLAVGNPTAGDIVLSLPENAEVSQLYPAKNMNGKMSFIPRNSFKIFEISPPGITR